MSKMRAVKLLIGLWNAQAYLNFRWGYMPEVTLLSLLLYYIVTVILTHLCRMDFAT